MKIINKNVTDLSSITTVNPISVLEAFDNIFLFSLRSFDVKNLEFLPPACNQFALAFCARHSSSCSKKSSKMTSCSLIFLIVLESGIPFFKSWRLF